MRISRKKFRTFFAIFVSRPTLLILAVRRTDVIHEPRI